MLNCFLPNAAFKSHGSHASNIAPINCKIIKRSPTGFRTSRRPFKVNIKAAADLGHYVGDAHVPLHTTSNYNGQKTGQKGIHAFWESRIPELSGEQYSNFVPSVNYVENPQIYIWEAVTESHRLLDSVLLLEKAVRESLGEEEMYTIAKKGQSLQRVISPAFAHAYEQAMNGMVERRYRSAIHALSSLWYTAWVNAGQPNLPFEKLRMEADTSLLTQDSSLVLPGHAE